MKNLDFIEEIVVIDGNSTDDTVKIAKTFNITILHQKSKGKGGAVIEALEYFDPDDKVIMIDGDNTYDPAEAKKFIPLFKPKTLVNGSRFKGQIKKNSLSTFHYIGNIGFNVIIQLLYRRKISDLLSGMKGFIVKDLRNLELKAKDFEIEAELVSKYLKLYKIVEVPINYFARMGNSKLNTIQDGLRIFRRIIFERIKI